MTESTLSAPPLERASLLRSYILPFIIWLIYQPLRASWRVTVVETPELTAALQNRDPLVFAHWHGDELAMIYLLNRYRASAITSTSKDGELINGFLRRMGVPTSRGSSTRGGVSALKGILRLAKLGYNPSVAVDGPKGPYHKVKPGVFEMSRTLRAPIHPVGCHCSRAHIFQRSWNKTYLPLPFSRIAIVWGKPMSAVERNQECKDPDLAHRLETSLADAQLRARNLIAGG